ncbi:hypothetical protein [Pedobacter ureilyticus]|uniref:Uncharacterized protein n=1 Tax=Pedobacter ureilyticus TaxID=1393051 RepID=A0ABW9JAZ0_9SPHI|nr:hypothetical protein [Pedobacter helvus]
MKRSVSLFLALILSSTIEQLWAKTFGGFLMPEVSNIATLKNKPHTYLNIIMYRH